MHSASEVANADKSRPSPRPLTDEGRGAAAGLYRSVGEGTGAMSGDAGSRDEGPGIGRPSRRTRAQRDGGAGPSEAIGSARLDQVGSELASLRTLVEQQLSGLAWRDLARRQPHRAGVLLRLLDFGLAPQIAKSIVDAMAPEASLEGAWATAKAELIRQIPLSDEDLLVDGGVAALVGPTGVGKTTTIAKLAGAYLLRHGPGTVGLVTTDDYRLGAHEQLRAFGRVLDIPVQFARDAAGVREAVEQYDDRSLVLIDTEGMRQRTEQPYQQLAMLEHVMDVCRVYVLLAANAQAASHARTIAAFRRDCLTGSFITKVDESGALGEVLSALVDARLPVAYISDGQQVPDDLHLAAAEDLVRRGEALMGHPEGELEDEIMGLTFGSMVANGRG
jgi:flagellar biosynthesis protein FlhF